MTHSIHKEGDILQIYFCVIFLVTRHHLQAHVTSAALIHCALSLATRTQMAAQLGWWFRWPVFVMATLKLQNTFCAWSSSSNQSGGEAILALSNFLNQIPHHEPESWWLYLRGGTDKSLALPTSRCRRTESTVSLEREVCSRAELHIVSCYRGWKEACQVTRTISTTWRCKLS